MWTIFYNNEDIEDIGDTIPISTEIGIVSPD